MVPARFGGFVVAGRSKSVVSIAEMKEFAGFSASTQRYLRRSLDVAEGGADVLVTWARDDVEAAQIRAQSRMYRRIPALRDLVPGGSDLLAAEPMMAPLVTLSAFDLGQGRLPTF